MKEQQAVQSDNKKSNDSRWIIYQRKRPEHCFLLIKPSSKIYFWQNHPNYIAQAIENLISYQNSKKIICNYSFQLKFVIPLKSKSTHAAHQLISVAKTKVIVIRTMTVVVTYSVAQVIVKHLFHQMLTVAQVISIFKNSDLAWLCRKWKYTRP